MKFLFGLLGLFICFPLFGAKVTFDDFLDVLTIVESNNDPYAVGDNGRAFGILQIHEIMVRDYNRIYDENYVHEDAFDPRISREIARGIFAHYTKSIEEPTTKHLAFIWNGGGSAWKRVDNPKNDRKQANLERYWRKCHKVMTEQYEHMWIP